MRRNKSPQYDPVGFTTLQSLRDHMLSRSSVELWNVHYSRYTDTTVCWNWGPRRVDGVDDICTSWVVVVVVYYGDTVYNTSALNP